MHNAPALPPNKTKLVCTIGPASDSPARLDEMIEENRSKMAASLSIEEYDLVMDRIRLEIEKALLERSAK